MRSFDARRFAADSFSRNGDKQLHALNVTLATMLNETYNQLDEQQPPFFDNSVTATWVNDKGARKRPFFDITPSDAGALAIHGTLVL